MMPCVGTFSMYVLKAYGLLLWKRFEIMEKLYTSKTFLKMVGGRMHTPHPIPLAISYRNHPNIVACFSHLAPIILFFFTKRQSQKEGPWHNASVNTLSFRPIKVLMVDFPPKKNLGKKKVFVVRDEAPYFSEALGFSLLSLLLNPVLLVSLKLTS